MHKSVSDAWHAFSTPFEGRIYSMYVDVKNLVTTAVGCLIDPVPLALTLEWRHAKTGQLATREEIERAWNELKHHPGFEVKGKIIPLSKLHYREAAKLNDLRLDDAAIDRLVAHRLQGNVAVLRKTFPAWDTFPADAQLGILSMAWACGAGFTKTFVNFTRFAQLQDWENAKKCDDFKTDGNPGVIPRDKADDICFDNAALVLKQGLPIDHLYWPAVAHAEAPTLAPTDTEWIRLVAEIRGGQRERDQAGIDAARLEEMADLGMASQRAPEGEP